MLASQSAPKPNPEEVTAPKNCSSVMPKLQRSPAARAWVSRFGSQWSVQLSCHIREPCFARPVLGFADQHGPIISRNQGLAADVDSFVGLRLDRVEVAYGVAVVLPLLLEDHMQAGEDGLLVLGVVRVPSR